MSLWSVVRRGGTAVAVVVTSGALSAAPALARDAGHPPPPPQYLGKVTAQHGLHLRDAPTRGSQVVRTVPYGTVVHIFCQTRGDHVNGNDRWYQLTDGTWTWGAAAYIATLGDAPRWC